NQAKREMSFHGRENSRSTALAQNPATRALSQRLCSALTLSTRRRVTALTPMDSLWLTEAVRLREEHAGPLEDMEANRRARAASGDLTTRIKNRALWLAERDGLVSALRHWKQGARLALLVLAVVVILSGAGLAFAALGN